ncbi:hypothetical protein BDP27DRAFT_1013359 [Rhodocollybia butyracea]|uniref:Uncharacterized protein n=1 Tax=Rhodocollybia butyracea TaxID=206335 RepID=A0A9P5PQV7_9AGAR|nr:hypothetical protein BDP27DRAFT_1013359 [Rhodocollybia butyracea]
MSSDIIMELISASNMGSPMAEHLTTKRRRSHDDDTDNGENLDPSTTSRHSIPGSNPSGILCPPLEFGLTEISPSLPSPSVLDFSGLPLHSEDLGRLPVHWMDSVGSLPTDFNAQAQDLGLYPPFGEDYRYTDFNSTPSSYVQPNISTVLDEGTLQTLAYSIPGPDQWTDWGAYIASVDELLNFLRS